MVLNPENVLMIGDDFIVDIYGGNKCGIITDVVNSVIEEKVQKNKSRKNIFEKK